MNELMLDDLTEVHGLLAKFGTAKGEVTRLRRYTGLTEQHVKRARTLLIEGTKGKFRTFSRKPECTHSLRIGGEAADCLAGSIFAEKPEIVRFARILGYLHDGVEDHWLTYEQIEKEFGQSMAYSVYLLTTPPLLQLVQKYTNEVTRGGYFVHKDLWQAKKQHDPQKRAEAYKQLLKNLKREHPETYSALKNTLAMEDKKRKTRLFGFVEIAVRASDNASNLRDYVHDITNNDIKISQQGTKNPSKITRRNGVASIPQSKIDGIIRKRITAHKLYMARLHQLRRSHGAKSEIQAPTTLGIHSFFFRVVDDHFWSIEHKLKRMISQSTPHIRAAHTRQAPALPRRHSPVQKTAQRKAANLG